MDPESSFDLILRAQGGDGSALDRLLSRYRPRLQRWASGRLPRYAREAVDTEDLVQEALIRTFRNFKDFEQRTEWGLQAYLRRAVVNRIRDELRRHGVRPRLEPLEDGPASQASPLEIASGQETFEAYDRGLAALGELEREAVISRLELGCSYQEIADLIAKPTPDAARMVVARALDKLARSMSSPPVSHPASPLRPPG